jgi:hypothetical protein
MPGYTKNVILIAMQLVELIAYGPDTFGIYREIGGDPENNDENVHRKSKTALACCLTAKFVFCNK